VAHLTEAQRAVEALLGEYAVAHPEIWPELADAERETRLQLLAWMTLTKFELGETVKKLDEAGVAYAVVKGPVLAGHAYGGLEYRAFSDVDLLITRRDLDRTLVALGSSATPAPRGATLRGVPISGAGARPHRGQIYFRSTRDTLGHSVAAAGRLVAEVARTRR
jgi:hypothetical protein